MNFTQFNLDSRLMVGVKKSGYDVATPIQEAAIPAALRGRDIIGTAQTGTGKTAAFVLPILNKLLTGGQRNVPRALIVAPTRELAEQINDVVKVLAAGTKIKSATIYGGVGANPQIQALRNGAEILIACPGRLLDLINQGYAKMGNIEILVLDEADRMFDMGFLPDVRRIVKAVPAKRQTMFFSATFPADVELLAQGTLYPDVIESATSGSIASTIKTHHNRVDQIMELKRAGRVIEPLDTLFKDEVRELGRVLGLPERVVGRHPFPGPGHAVRCPGEVTQEKLEIIQKADKIYIDLLRERHWYDSVWQAYAALIPTKTVGVKGDERSYEYALSLRAVTSEDAMTAEWVHLPYELLAEISNRILNEVSGVNRVLYDISTKPPASIEWE